MILYWVYFVPIMSLYPSFRLVNGSSSLSFHWPAIHEDCRLLQREPNGEKLIQGDSLTLLELLLVLQFDLLSFLDTLLVH